VQSTLGPRKIFFKPVGARKSVLPTVQSTLGPRKIFFKPVGARTGPRLFFRAQVPFAIWKPLCDLFVSDGDGLGATDITPVLHFVDIDSDFFREALPACWRFFGAFLGFFSHTFLGFAKRFKA
jgi:hypothetical protein